VNAIDIQRQALSAVVIGTSAGGVEALMRILPSLPATMPVAILIVVHIPRERPSLLTDIFRQKCAMRVEEGIDKADIKPGHIYFAPPDYHMLVDAGPQIALSVDDAIQFSRPSIDVLFESAADVYGKKLLGILLTGGNEDGASGLAYIARCGGMTVLQDPAEAAAPAMPESALKVMTPTHVLRLDEIAALLMTIATRTTP
jgi:two-component system, chemotaxis family, protein-glutamate methylesterase/glutaminase